MIELNRFVPRFVHRWALHHSQPELQVTDPAPGVILVADISGFTPLTETLAARGQAGIEAIQAILNQVFDRIVTAIESGGGEVTNFAGDATIAWWPTPNDSLRNALLEAVSTGLRLQALMPELHESAGVPLQLRVGIAVGDCWTAMVGGINGRWEAILGGSSFQQLVTLGGAPSGSVTLSAEANKIVHDVCQGDQLPDGSARVLQVSPVHTARPRDPTPQPSPKELILSFIPPHVVSQVSAGQEKWLAEVRPVSVLFASVDLTSIALTDGRPLQRIVEALQRSVFDFGGTIIQLLVDDRGDFVMVAVWGTPSSSYENDAERAVQSANTLNTRLGPMRVAHAVGIASGKVFAGIRGARTRAEYAVIGNVVNRAARLMQAADGNVWCDSATARAATAISFVAGPSLTLKGMGATAVFEARGRAISVAEKTSGHLVGRSAELNRLRQAVEQVAASSSTSRAVVVVGEAGIGKSHLTAALADALAAAGTPLARSEANPLDTQTAYRPLEPVLVQLLGLTDAISRDDRSSRLLAQLGADVTRREHAPLLNSVLNLALPENATTRAMTGRGRSQATQDLLVGLLQKSANGPPRVVILEDVHWMDSPSWALVERALRQCSGLCVVMVTRPVDAYTLPPQATAIFESAGTVRIELTALDTIAIADMIAQQLVVERVPDMLVQLVHERTHGHPLFVRQVVASMQESAIVRVANGRVTVDQPTLEAFAIPDTLQGVIASRLDRLSAQQQLTAKVASVLGRVFTFEALEGVFPHDAGVLDVPAARAANGVAGMIGRGKDPSEYRFSHAVVRDTVYGLLPLDRRRSLHAAAATWYERQYPEDSSYYARVATHFTEAHDADRAPKALERAGDHALQTGAYRESRGFFDRLVALTRVGFGDESSGPIPATVDQRGRWLWKLGLSEYDLGDLERGGQNLETAAGVLGHPVPRPGGPLRLALIREGGRQVMRRLLRTRRRGWGGDTTPLQVARILNVLGRIYHLGQKPESTLYTILRRFNLVEDRGPSPELLSGLSGMIYLVTLLGRHRLADEYIALLKETNREVKRPFEYADAMYPVTVTRLGQGQWQSCRREANEALEIFKRLGERHASMAEMAVLANLEELVGNLSTSWAVYSELGELAEETGDRVSQTWAWGGLAMVALRQGRLESALEMATRAGDAAWGSGESVSYLSSRGTLAVTHLRCGNFEAVRSLVDEAIPLLEACPKYATAHHNLNGYDSMSEAILTLWETDPAGGRNQYRKPAALACGLLRRYARTFPIGRAAATIWTGLEEWLLGRPDRAMRSWRKAASEGARLGIPYDMARAHLELARHSPAGSAEREEHRHTALTTFEQIGASAQVSRAIELHA